MVEEALASRARLVLAYRNPALASGPELDEIKYFSLDLADRPKRASKSTRGIIIVSPKDLEKAAALSPVSSWRNQALRRDDDARLREQFHRRSPSDCLAFGPSGVISAPRRLPVNLLARRRDHRAARHFVDTRGRGDGVASTTVGARGSGAHSRAISERRPTSRCSRAEAPPYRLPRGAGVPARRGLRRRARRCSTKIHVSDRSLPNGAIRSQIIRSCTDFGVNLSVAASLAVARQLSNLDLEEFARWLATIVPGSDDDRIRCILPDNSTTNWGTESGRALTSTCSCT